MLGLISLLFSLYLAWHLLGDLPNRMVAGNPADIRLFIWYLEHDSQSVLHGHDPLLFTTMNAPVGVSAMWNTSLLLPALVMTPVTLLAGPLAAYNVLFVLALATGPLCAFPLLRRFTDSGPAAGLGALVFGFSPAVLASGIGHINLVLTGLMPVTLLLADDLVTGRRAPWPGGAALGLAMAAQLFTSEELLFQTALVLLVAGVLVGVTRPRAITAPALGRIGRGAAAALGVFVFSCGGALWLQFWGPLHQYGSPFTVGYFVTDVRGFYVPSNLLWLTTRGSSAFAASYVPGAPEYLAYLGIPLLVTAPIVGLARIGDLRTRLLLGVGAVFALFSLGGTLLNNGRYTAAGLPWGTLRRRAGADRGGHHADRDPAWPAGPAGHPGAAGQLLAGHVVLGGTSHRGRAGYPRRAGQVHHARRAAAAAADRRGAAMAGSGRPLGIPAQDGRRSAVRPLTSARVALAAWSAALETGSSSPSKEPSSSSMAWPCAVASVTAMRASAALASRPQTSSAQAWNVSSRAWKARRNSG